MQGLLPQVHVAWSHPHEPVCASGAHGDPEWPIQTPWDSGHPSCAICQAFLTSPALSPPVPPPAVQAALAPIGVVPPSGSPGIVVGFDYRWSLARGPPQA